MRRRCATLTRTSTRGTVVSCLADIDGVATASSPAPAAAGTGAGSARRGSSCSAATRCSCSTAPPGATRAAPGPYREVPWTSASPRCRQPFGRRPKKPPSRPRRFSHGTPGRSTTARGPTRPWSPTRWGPSAHNASTARARSCAGSGCATSPRSPCTRASPPAGPGCSRCWHSTRSSSWTPRTSSAPVRTAGGTTEPVPQHGCSSASPAWPSRGSPAPTALLADISGRSAAWPDWVVVLEGQARSAVAPAGVTAVRADSSGDDAIVSRVTQAGRDGRIVTVVTADRELRQRVQAAGGRSVGPRVLLDALDALADKP